MCMSVYVHGSKKRISDPPKSGNSELPDGPLEQLYAVLRAEPLLHPQPLGF